MESPPRTTQWICGVLVLLSRLITVLGVDETHVATVAPQDNLVSPGWIFNLNYGVNVTYDYLVTTDYPNHTITFTLVDCEIEHDKNSACLYDHLYIYDGVNSSATLLVDFCCGTTSATWETTGDQAYLLFTSDISNNGRGFQLEYQSTGWTSTTTTTTTSTTSTSTTTTTPTTTSTTTTTPTTTSTTPTTTTTTTTTTPTTTTTTSTTTTPTTTTTVATSTTAGQTTQQPPGSGGGGGGDSSPPLGLIIGCTLGGCLLILLLILAIRYFCNRKQQQRGVTPDTPDTETPSENKGEYLSRENTALSRSKPFFDRSESILSRAATFFWGRKNSVLHVQPRHPAPAPPGEVPNVPDHDRKDALPSTTDGHPVPWPSYPQETESDIFSADVPDYKRGNNLPPLNTGNLERQQLPPLSSKMYDKIL